MILYIQTFISLIRSVHVISMKKCVFLHIMHFSSSVSVSSSLSSSGRFTFFTGSSFCFAAKTSSILSCFSWFFRLDFLVFLIRLCSNNQKVLNVYFHLWTWWWNCIYSPSTILCARHLKSLQSPHRVKPIKSSCIN